MKSEQSERACNHNVKIKVYYYSRIRQGKMVAAELGVKYAALHYKTLELDKDKALKINKGNFDAEFNSSEHSKECIRWWIQNIS